MPAAPRHVNVPRRVRQMDTPAKLCDACRAPADRPTTL